MCSICSLTLPLIFIRNIQTIYQLRSCWCQLFIWEYKRYIWEKKTQNIHVTKVNSTKNGLDSEQVSWQASGESCRTKCKDLLAGTRREKYRSKCIGPLAGIRESGVGLRIKVPWQASRENDIGLKQCIGILAGIRRECCRSKTGMYLRSISVIRRGRKHGRLRGICGVLYIFWTSKAMTTYKSWHPIVIKSLSCGHKGEKHKTYTL